MPYQHDRKELMHLEQEIFRLRKRIDILSAPLAVVLKRRGFQIFSQ